MTTPAHLPATTAATAITPADPIPAPGIVDGVDVDAVAAAVTSCPAVAALDAGSPINSVVTYLPGRRVPGVRVTGDTVSIQVTIRWGIPVTELGDQVRRALNPLVAGRAVDIRVSDIAEPALALPPGDTAAAAVPVPAPAPPAIFVVPVVGAGAEPGAPSGQSQP